MVSFKPNGQIFDWHGVAPDVCLHALRATVATNAVEQQADIAYVQMWLGHASIDTTRLYDRRIPLRSR